MCARLPGACYVTGSRFPANPEKASATNRDIMTDPIADAAVALSLMLEALSLLDAPEDEAAAAHLRNAIDALSAKQ